MILRSAMTFTNSVSCWAVALLIAEAATCAGVGAAEPTGWPNWRGPFGNGVAAAGKYPTSWSPEKNIQWQVALEGRGASTPAVAGERLFVTSASDKANQLQAFRLDGQQEWSVEIGKPRAAKHAKATGSNSSPTTDGEFIFAYFKSGDVACCRVSGEIVWQVNLQSQYGEDTLWWDLGTSPVLTRNAIVIAVMQSGPSYLLALDRTSGKVLWRADRQLPAPNEANQSYSTPVVAELEGLEILLTLGADHLTCHAAADGKLLWQQGGFNPEQEQYFRSISSPVLAGQLVICPYARGNTLTAVRSQVNGNESRIAWQRTDLGSDVPTPTISGDRLYVVGDKGKLWCLDPSTGTTLWEGELPKHRLAYSSSPVVAGGHVYITREDATTFVVKDGPKYELVATNTLPGNTVATPVLAADKAFVRTYDHLYCISGNATPAQQQR